jgi:hypothetical protein
VNKCTALFVFGAAGLLTPDIGRAQADRYAPTVLQIAPTPRAATFGNVTAVRDIEAVFSNPAMVGVAAGSIAGFGRFGAATHLMIASATSLGSFSVGVGAQYLDALSQSNELPYWSYSLRAGGHLPTASAVGALSLATTYRGNRLGATGKYVVQRIGSVEDAVPSLDVGLARDVSRYTVGVTVQNVGAGIHLPNSGAQLPLRVSAGVATYGWQVSQFDLNGSAGLSVLPDGILLPGAGVEVNYNPLEGYSFALRGSLKRPELRAQRPLSVGGSAGLDRFAVEYAFEDWVGGGVHRLALRVR